MAERHAEAEQAEDDEQEQKPPEGELEEVVRCGGALLHVREDRESADRVHADFLIELPNVGEQTRYVSARALGLWDWYQPAHGILWPDVAEAADAAGDGGAGRSVPCRWVVD